MTLVVTTFLAILTLLAALGLIAITLSDPAADAAVGRPVPTLSGTGLDGQPIAIGPDGPLVIVVIAHWCPRCQAELPGLVELIDGGGVPDGVSVLELSTAIDVVRPNYPPSAWFEREDGDSRR